MYRQRGRASERGRSRGGQGRRGSVRAQHGPRLVAACCRQKLARAEWRAEVKGEGDGRGSSSCPRCRVCGRGKRLGEGVNGAGRTARRGTGARSAPRALEPRPARRRVDLPLVEPQAPSGQRAAVRRTHPRMRICTSRASEGEQAKGQLACGTGAGGGGRRRQARASPGRRAIGRAPSSPRARTAWRQGRPGRQDVRVGPAREGRRPGLAAAGGVVGEAAEGRAGDD